jgi:hypothetical protein
MSWKRTSGRDVRTATGMEGTRAIGLARSDDGRREAREIGHLAMGRPVVVVFALLLAACGNGASGPCGPCQTSASAGMQNVALPWSPKLKELAAKRLDVSRKRLVLLRASFDKGKATLDEVFVAFRDFAVAARDSGLAGGDLRDVLREYRDAMVALKDLTRERMSKGDVGEDALLRVESLVAEAEYWLEEASQGP